jgi:hypothetical protein
VKDPSRDKAVDAKTIDNVRFENVTFGYDPKTPVVAHANPPRERVNACHNRICELCGRAPEDTAVGRPGGSAQLVTLCIRWSIQTAAPPRIFVRCY